MKTFFLLISALFAFACASDVLDLDPSNFDSVVGGDLPVFVKFVAPWCGHCKNLAPEYEIVATSFAKSGAVKIASVDADAHRDLGSRFGIQGFPSLRFFPAGSKTAEDYEGGRSAADIVDFINKKVGTNIRIKSEPTAVVVLTESNFDEIVLDSSKDVLVEFYAPWCGHCKSLAPVYETLAKSFEGESSVVIAKVDADSEKVLAKRFDIQGYPTLKFFPKSNKDGVEYDGGRQIENFVSFINEKANTERVVGGGFLPSAGRIEALDSFVTRFVSATSATEKEAILSEAVAALEDDSVKSSSNYAFAKFYTITMKKLLTDSNYASKETDRLSRMLQGSSLKASDVASFSKRKNIVSQFA